MWFKKYPPSGTFCQPRMDDPVQPNLDKPLDESLSEILAHTPVSPSKASRTLPIAAGASVGAVAGLVIGPIGAAAGTAIGGAVAAAVVSALNHNVTDQQYVESRGLRWIPDEECLTCAKCEQPFSFYWRKHHCRLDGKVYCCKCCNSQVPLEILGVGVRPMLVCVDCKDALTDFPEIQPPQVARKKQATAYQAPVPYEQESLPLYLPCSAGEQSNDVHTKTEESQPVSGSEDLVVTSFTADERKFCSDITIPEQAKVADLKTKFEELQTTPPSQPVTTGKRWTPKGSPSKATVVTSSPTTTLSDDVEPSPIPMTEPGTFCAYALFDFIGEQEGDLSLMGGEEILVIDTSDPGGWWKGRNAEGEEGIFPCNFIQIEY